MSTILALATAAAEALSPYFVAGATSAVKAAGGEAVKSLATLVRSAFIGRGKSGDLTAFQKAPGDASARERFRRELVAALEADPELRAEVEKLVAAARPDMSQRASVKDGGSVVQIMGNQNTVASGGGQVRRRKPGENRS